MQKNLKIRIMVFIIIILIVGSNIPSANIIQYIAEDVETDISPVENNDNNGDNIIKPNNEKIISINLLIFK